MKVVSLMENTSNGPLRPAHGLSLYIETQGLHILFDIGPSYDILKENAEKMSVDLSSADCVVISHGHYDHGGALEGFLSENKKAAVFVRKDAFEPHYNITHSPRKYIGLDPSLSEHPSIVKTGSSFVPFEGGLLFTVKGKEKYHSPANDVLTCGECPDEFSHEQHLLIREGDKTFLFCGCGHKGIVNIMKKARRFKPDFCFGGFHLSNPTTGESVSEDILDGVAKELGKYNTIFYTCHCTGERSFRYLSGKTDNIRYFSCGETFEI
ncbi:MAG: MBL fold metallo-hydrolase [Clostridia bacterium]|nr:MBL fold metallo-hydrolase [Clostridia bacterium]